MEPKPEAIPLHQSLDEWDRSSGLSSFREKLLQDLRSGDQAGILSAFSEGIEFNPGTDKGPAGVVELWGLDGTENKLAKLKALLDTLLSDGGCMVQIAGDSAFKAPSYNCLSDSSKSHCEETGCGVITDAGAELRKEARSDADIQAVLIENEVVVFEGSAACDSLHDNCGWRKVSRANGQKGYLPFSGLRTESDGVIRIDKELSGWKIRVLSGPGILTDDV